MKAGAVLGCFLVGFVLCLSGCAEDPRQPGYQVTMLTDMSEAVPAESFSESGVFSDGKTMQLPPQGTIPRGFMPFPYEKTDADAKRAGAELSNPFQPTTQNIERGKFVFENFCLACHGATGDGDGQLIPRYPNPPAFLDKRLLAMPDGEMFHSITLGKKDMPPHASQISKEDRWKVILYIRELQKMQGN